MTIAQSLLSTLCWFTTGSAHLPDHMYRTRILGGPLRGMLFTMPQLERLSFALGNYEPHIVTCIQNNVQAGGVTYDIGANAGYLTMLMARLGGPTARIFAFEPVPHNIAALQANITLNRLNNVTLVPQAVSDASGDLTFAAFQYSLVGHIATSDTPRDAQLITVSATTLDEFVFSAGNPAPSFIKIDVEGAEDRVLAGAERVLHEARPVVIAEVRAGEIYNHIECQMKRLNYTITPLEGGWQMGSDRLGDLLFTPQLA